jgi:hypothetical protein
MRMGAAQHARIQHAEQFDIVSVLGLPGDAFYGVYPWRDMANGR